MSSVRKIYETAFDSKVEPRDSDCIDNDDDLVAKSPLSPEAQTSNTNGHRRMSGISPGYNGKTETPGTRQGSPISKRALSSSKVGQLDLEPRKHSFASVCNGNNNKIASDYRLPGRFSRTYSMPKCLNEVHRYKKYHTEESIQTSGSGPSPPVRPHSDPLDRRKRDTSLQARLDETRPSRVFRLPLEQCILSSNNDVPSSNKTFSPSTEFKKLGVDDDNRRIVVDVANPVVSDNSNGSLPGKKQICVDEPLMQSNSCNAAAPTTTAAVCKDKSMEPPLTSRKNLVIINESAGEEQQNANHRGSGNDMKRNHSEVSARKKLHLDLSQPLKKPRHHFLNFWTPGHNAAFHERIDPDLELEKQGWYHGSINHKDAENVLRVLQEGSFLVRCCAKSKKSYSLSIKSANGVMHMKISQSDGQFGLKQQNQPFKSIPEMIHHFSMHPLSVYGLEHVILKSPVISQLL